MNSKLDDKTEQKITAHIASITGFKRTSEKYYTCDFCGRKFSIFYVGYPLNERMLDHYINYHLGK